MLSTSKYPSPLFTVFTDPFIIFMARSAAVAIAKDPSQSQSNQQLPASEGLPWIGILNHDQVATLMDQFSDTIVCPGYVSNFGHDADKCGRVFVAGARCSFSDSKRILERWKRLGSADERWTWWPAALEDKGIQPIMVRDILNGLQLSDWKEYRTRYNKISKVRLVTRRTAELKDIARSRLEKERAQQAATALKGLQESEEVHRPSRPRSRSPSKRLPKSRPVK